MSSFSIRIPDHKGCGHDSFALASAANVAVIITPNGGNSMQEKTKRAWVSPRVQRYGTFEEATQGCNKTYGAGDGFLFEGQAITCAS